MTARLFCDLGITTGPAFRYLIFMLSRGGTIYYFGASSESTIQAFDLYNIQTMITSPSGVAEYLKFYEQQRAFRCNFESIVSSGGLLPKSLSERVLGTMCQRLFSSYGATETGTIAFAPAQMIADVPGAVGFVTPGAEVEIVDASDNPLAAGKEGIVRTRTAQMVDGYVGNPEATARAFRNGWFYPGDIGSLTADGMLLIRGREASVLNIGGDKVKPELVEEALTAFAGVDQAAAFIAQERHGRAGAVGGAGVPARSRSRRVAGALRTPARAGLCPARLHPNRAASAERGRQGRSPPAGRVGEAQPAVMRQSAAQILPRFQGLEASLGAALGLRG